MDTYLPTDFAVMFKEATERMTQDARVRALLIAYDEALKDEKVVIPTSLHVVIEALRK